MANTAAVKISAAAAVCISAEATKEQKLTAARGEIPFPPRDLGVVMLYLCFDSDEEVRVQARHRMLHLPIDQLRAMLAQDDLHPRILDLIARCHFQKTELVEQLCNHPALAASTAVFLTEKTGETSALPLPSPSRQQPMAAADLSASPDEEEEYDVESEEHQSKYQLAQVIGVADKIKLALTGDKEWRSILIKDSNKQVSGAVIKNPRITEGEVLAIAKSSIQNDEILRVICGNKEWVKNYQIRKALVENHRTPLPTALRYLATLGEKDLATLAKSKSVSTVIATQARRQLLQKKRD